METNWQEMLFTFFGGLGIFLFAIKYMGDALQKAAGDKLRGILDRFTTNPFMGVLVGIVVTVLIQSSSGTTVIVVGLVSAGFMTLRQAIGVIMGANIGTTITAFIIGLDVGAYALPIMALGAFLIFFFKKNQIQNMGQVIFGFGGLFFGLELMSDGMKPLRESAAFIDLTISLSDLPILGVVVGTVFTLIVQSSSATVAILQGLYAENILTLGASLPVLFGDNIGTTITAVLAALGASIAAKRAAAVHVLFNVLGSVIFLILLAPFTMYVEWIAGVLNLEPKMQIAFAHGTFNVVNTIIQFPLIGAWAYLVTRVIPGQDVTIEFKPKHLDVHFIEQSPSIALGQAKEEVLRMGHFAVQGLQETYEYLKTKSKKDAEMGYQLEDAINNLDQKITDYLVLISAESLSAADSTRHTMLMETVRDIERIGDHFENIIELIDYQENNRVKITEDAMADLAEMFTLTIATVEKALNALDTTSHELAREVAEQEDLIDKMERKFRKKHILRLNEGQCSAQAGIVFVDIVSNLERIGDHSVNIAEAILGNRS
ncbi:sodium-dependent phosphate transporter [Planococcus glaciei]|uniref:Na/Pi cotransporter family protein n=1 Tax=Planococcus glaciei TaxID=459472 RepID=A0A7H8QFP1_9BACL|nr:Na/Pi cotransporter family protein [Planococcus glaciei]KOF11938.1 sodium-dependent phosphate transporter [Planococcus glaciei]MBX0314967.1 Na/Pi cotransporter family protein [Planococcus glaciei]QKX52719.1 Na/Pi cotransporter family protein [Planococcus glaciei]